MKVLLHGNEEDKNEFRERMSLVKAALEARESEDHERRLGNVTKAADYASRAGAFEREIKKREKNFEFSFQAAEKKQDLEFGMTKAEEMMKWTPQQVWENLSTVENILEGWRYMSVAEYSYLLDTGSPYSTVGAEPTYKVIKVSHPGIPANQLHARSGQTTEQGLLDYARRVGFDIERHEEPVSETVGEREGEEVSRGEFNASLKPL